jgi:glycosyltransferase involved in cell wall biosynthesis
VQNLVSILVPVYNRGSIISETLYSALSQTYDNIEVIVVDNASTDDTWEIIQNIAENDNRLKAFRNKTNIGPVRNWMRCVEEATGFYGKILWSDDLIAPDFLNKCMPLLDEETAFVYSGVKIFTDVPDNGNPCYFLGKTGHRPSSEYIEKALLEKNVPVSPGCALFRLKDIKNNLHVNVDNKINSDFSMHAIGNDLLLFLLTAKDYKNFAIVNEPLSFFRSHEGSISIASGDGKLPLHYMLIRVSFAERFRRDMLGQVSAKAWLLMKKYPKHSEFGIKDISDFFYGNVEIKYYFVFLIMIKYLIRMPLRVVKKAYRMLEA